MSYASQHARDIYIGLDSSPAARVDIVWPSGREETLERLEAGRLYLLVEARGAVAERPLAQRR